MKISKFGTVRPFLGAAAAAVALAFLPVATYSTVISDTLTADETKLTAVDGAAFDLFGVSVAVSGDTAVIGAYADDDNGINSGSAYVFEKTGGVWAEVAKLTASDRVVCAFKVCDTFGWSVSVSSDTAVVGAIGDDDNGSDAGSAYVFEKIGGVWVEVAKLTASDGAEDDEFGISVSLSGNTALVGAWLDGWGMTKPGSAWVFEFPEPTPEEHIDNLITSIEDLVTDGTLSSGEGTSLIKQLENALNSLDKGNDNAAINQLTAFANEVQALIDGGLLTEEEGLPLIDAALSTIDQILAG